MAGYRSKIVSLRPGAAKGGHGEGTGGDGGALDPVAGLLLRLHEQVKPPLMQAVQSMFDHADDALFELADKAGSNGEQNLYFESMRELRIRRRGIELALGRDLQEELRCFTRGSAAEGDRSQIDEPGADMLALVANDELEERVAIDSMVAKAEKEFAVLLNPLSARLQALMPTRPVLIRTNPLGPSVLCESFLRATHEIELDIKARLVLFKLFDRHVVNSLGETYRLADKLLADEGIQLNTNARPGGRASAAGAMGGANGQEGEQFFSDLQTLLEQTRSMPRERSSMLLGADGGRSGLVAPGLAPAMPRDALLQMLGEVQRQQLATGVAPAATMQSQGPQPIDVLRVLSRLLEARLPGQAVSIGQIDDDAINLVAMLFQFVLEDRNLAAPIKGLIARLQIPILKVAMLDKSFFGKGGHPARKLLNELANASLGWAPSGEIERDPFYRRLEEIIQFVADEFSGEVAVFEKALADFGAFVEMERRRAALVEQRTIDAEDGRARSEIARRRVDRLLRDRIAERPLPTVVSRLLVDGWSNVLFLVCLKEGPDSDEWRQALRTVDDLLESVEPVESLADRARLLRLLPGLLKRLRAGLGRVGVNPFELDETFEALEQIHLQRLGSEEVQTLVSDPATPARQSEAELPTRVAEAVVATPTAATASLDQVLNARSALASSPRHSSETPVGGMSDLGALDAELGALLGDELELPAEMSPDTTAGPGVGAEATAALEPEVVNAVAAPSPPISVEASKPCDAATLLQIDRLQVGGWVEFRQPGGKVMRCRLAAIIRATGKFIFVNRAGSKVAENNREGLATLVAREELAILDEGRLFDRALESVIGNLREMRERN